MTPDLHADLAPLADLVGTFRGLGRGHYPTIDDFAFEETVTFAHVGKPFLAYTQRTRSVDGGAPMHSETGYLRLAEKTAELVVAQPTGITEVHVGRATTDDGLVVDLEAVDIGATPTAKRVGAVRRRFELRTDVLIVDLWMAYGSVPLTHHLRSELRRVG
jgi:hypothetical protein